MSLGGIGDRSCPAGEGTPRAGYLGTLFLAVVLALLLLAQPVPGEPTAEAGDSILGYTGKHVAFVGVGTSDPSETIILYEWDFDGDGVYDWNSTQSGVATRIFPTPGNYSAAFRVTQYNAGTKAVTNATDTIQVQIISGKPTGRITTSTIVEVGSEHTMTTDFYDPDGGQLQFEWWIDGQLVSEEQTFERRFDELGEQNVTVYVIDDEGEGASSRTTLTVVEELKTGLSEDNVKMIAIPLVLLALVAAVAYASIIRSHRRGRTEPGDATLDTQAAQPAQIVTEGTLEDRGTEPERSTRPRVVRPERVVAKAKDDKAVPPSKPDGVPAAPDRLPCPECGTELDDEGACPFCEANEAIDGVERRVRELQDDGFIIAEAEERLDVAKAELHVKSFASVRRALEQANTAMDEAMREHERCMRTMALVEDLLDAASERDIDPSKAANLLKLSRSFLKSGKYPKALHYAQRSRDHLLDKLDPFDLDRYFCDHCKEEVDVEAEECPHCLKAIESGLIKRARRELEALRRRFDGLARDHSGRGHIEVQLEKAEGHVEALSAAAANEHIQRASELLDVAEGGGEPPAPPEEPAPEGEEEPPEEPEDGEGADAGDDGGEASPEDAEEGTAVEGEGETGSGAPEGDWVQYSDVKAEEGEEDGEGAAEEDDLDEGERVD